MTVCSIDFETRSTVDLRRSGVYPYAEHPDTDVICMAYAIGDVEPRVWIPPRVWAVLYDRPYPTNRWNDLRDHVWGGGEMRAHNAQFERIIWRDLLGPRYGLLVPEMEQWVCTAAEAAAMSLPRDLKTLSHVLKVSEQKDDAGHQLMLQMCRPRSKKGGVLTWWDETDPEKLKLLIEYCKQDIRAERACAKKLRRLCKTERRVYLLDQKINDRGVLLDVPLIEAAQVVVDLEMVRANAELTEITEGKVTSVTKVADLAAFVGLDNVQKATVRDILEDPEADLTPVQRRALELRAEVGKSSTSKMKAMQRCRCSDDRARGMYLYHGAGPGRWTGKLVQLQNFPRPGIKRPERAIPLLLRGEADRLKSPMTVVTSLLRGMLRASPGHRMLAGDYGQIEARIVCWFGGEVFDKQDYERMGAHIFQVPQETIGKDDPARQAGKGAVLGCGFQMGPPTFRDQVHKQTGILLTDEQAVRGVQGYRADKPGVKQLWYDIEAAAMAAVEEPGKITRVGVASNIKYVVRNQFLWCILPSGRPIAYALPTLRERTITWTDIKGEEHSARKLGLNFMGVNSLTRKWERQHAYGGLLTENVVQATARDLLAGAMLRMEHAGYAPILHSHDEAVSDTPNGHGSLEEYLEIMAQTPSWLGGLPVEVEGWEGERYRK